MPSRPSKKKAAPKTSYKDMIIEAIADLKDRTGSSAIAIEKYIIASFKKVDFKRFRLRAAIKRGLEAGWILVHHNHKNSYKLPAGKKKAAPKKKKAATKKKATKKTKK